MRSSAWRCASISAASSTARRSIGCAEKAAPLPGDSRERRAARDSRQPETHSVGEEADHRKSLGKVGTIAVSIRFECVVGASIGASHETPENRRSRRGCRDRGFRNQHETEPTRAARALGRRARKYVRTTQCADAHRISAEPSGLRRGPTTRRSRSRSGIRAAPAGLVGDRLGDVVAFFELSDRQAHRLFCDCHYNGTMTGAGLAARLRRIAKGGLRAGLLERRRAADLDRAGGAVSSPIRAIRPWRRARRRPCRRP